ncbi:MAG: two-component system, OmpR family, phosphate regulon sensor histidine kinase PhoR [Thermodesulfobacteriota bacterium]|nr:two-component system, OmpR family, phosphate regulon sensor histidine kinase PhoR [Thermodesulfobacteriota bacterium]
MNKTINILVVDDEKAIRDGCHRVLTGKGYAVVTAENGKIALDILLKEAIDIILLDLKMPVMGGEEILGIVRKTYPDIPVIIITGHGTVDTAVVCMKSGAYDFITKPFQIDQFLLTITRAAEKRRLEQKAIQLKEENMRNLYDLNLEKSRLKAIINRMANGVMVTNRNLEVVLHNPALMRLMEMSTEIENPAPISRITDERSLIDTLKQILTGEFPEEESISQEIEAGKRTLRAISAPALGPDKNIAGTVTVLEDITAYKQLDQMKSDFVNMVAHELRSPLVSIRQINSVLIEGLAGPLAEKQQEFVKRGMNKIDSLLELINDLLDVARIEAGKMVQHRVPTDMGRIIEETVALMGPRAQEQGIHLTHSCEGLKPVLADPKNMEEVINNLVSNAVNYSPEGGLVMIIARGLAEYMEIKVEDTGVGISPEELPKIFDKFYRVKHPKTRQVMGTGLGLAIVKGVVEAHHGTIDVESVVDRGTTFRVLLPMIV